MDIKNIMKINFTDEDNSSRIICINAVTNGENYHDVFDLLDMGKGFYGGANMITSP